MGRCETGQVEGPVEGSGVVVAGGAVVLAGRLGRLDGKDLDPLFHDQAGLAFRSHLGGFDLFDLFLHAFCLILEREGRPGEIDPRIQPVPAVGIELAQVVSRVALGRLDVQGFAEVLFGVVEASLPVGDDPRERRDVAHADEEDLGRVDGLAGLFEALELVEVPGCPVVGFADVVGPELEEASEDGQGLFFPPEVTEREALAEQGVPVGRQERQRLLVPFETAFNLLHLEGDLGQGDEDG